MRDLTHMPPEEASFFEPEEFAKIYNLVSRSSKLLAARRRAGLNVKGGDDSAAVTSARGATLSQAFSVVWERYEGDPIKYHSAVHRMTALAKLIKSSHLNKWIRVTGEGVAVHKAVLAAAAVMPLNRKCEFSVADFLNEVETRVADES